MAVTWRKFALALIVSASISPAIAGKETEIARSTLPDIADNFDSYRVRKKGDAALATGNYTEAERLYRQYVSSGAARGDAPAVRDGTIRIVNLYLQQNKSAEAEKELEEFKQKFFIEDALVIKVLEAEIKLLKRDFQGGENLLREVLATAELPENLYNLSAFTLGEALTMQKKYLEAAEVYGLLSVKSHGDFDAAFRQIYALQLGNELIASQNALDSLLAVPPDGDRLEAIEILRINQAIREKRFSEARTMYEALPLPDAPDYRRYALVMELFSHFNLLNENTSALQFLEQAFMCATDTMERKYVLTLMIELYAAEGDNDSAIDRMKRYLAYYPDDGNYYDNTLQLAHLLNRAEKYQGAAIIYNLLVNDKKVPLPMRLTAARECSGVYQLVGSPAEAEKMLAFIIAESHDAESTADGNLLMANLYYNIGNYPKSIELAKRAAEANTEWKFPALYVLMCAQEQEKEYKDALITARILKNQGIDDWPQKGAFSEAKLLEVSGDIQGAIAAYANFGALWNFSAAAQDALYSAGTLAFSSGDYARAAEMFQLMVSRYPHYQHAAHGLYLAVYSEYLQGEYREMEVLTEQLRRSYPNSKYTIGALFWKLDLLKLENKLKEAEELLTQMMEGYKNSTPDVIGQIRFEQAQLAISTAKESSAITLLKEIIESETPDGVKAKALFTLGDIHMKFGEYIPAEQCFKQAGQLAPDEDFAVAALGRMADSYYNSGLLDMDAKKLEGALTYYLQVLNKTSEHGIVFYQTHFKLGTIYAALNNTSLARENFKEVLIAAAGSNGVSAEELKWVWKSVESLVELSLKEGTAAALDDALKCISLTDGMNDGNNKFAELKKRVMTAYQLKN